MAEFPWDIRSLDFNHHLDVDDSQNLCLSIFLSSGPPSLIFVSVPLSHNDLYIIGGS